MRYKNKKFLGDLWYDEYKSKDGQCLLCHKNNGKLGTVEGDRFCICPNGRTFKAVTKQNKP